MLIQIIHRTATRRDNDSFVQQKLRRRTRTFYTVKAPGHRKLRTRGRSETHQSRFTRSPIRFHSPLTHAALYSQTMGNGKGRNHTKRLHSDGQKPPKLLKLNPESPSNNSDSSNTSSMETDEPRTKFQANTSNPSTSQNPQKICKYV